MTKKFFPILIMAMLLGTAQAAPVWITIDNDAAEHTKSHLGKSTQIFKSMNGITMMKIDEQDVPSLSHEMHHDFKRCGGFVAHDSKEDALATLSGESKRVFAKKNLFSDYSINQQDLVRPAVAMVKSSNISQTITKLQEFHNRYYQSQYGVDSQKYVKSKWASLIAARNDASVEFFQHSKWKQPSVVLTIKGSVSPDEVIIIGGHADSIAGYFGGSRNRAPGADDNASGISTITEVIRVLADSNYQPKKTLKFMGYAAEEVGLRGSKEIAQKMKSDGANILGVMQLDMTNYNGSDLDIVMMTDYTNSTQNEFIGNLIDEYVSGVSWGYDKCGYACSDHASWHNAGFPASMPFEAKKRDMNGNIHTSRDTISVSRNNASHAAKFAKMALSFVIELDR
ncbi:MAG: M20/M25/M40 family metallo-hydrolase [Bacteriovoracaceae bacterium]|nr:M20/M25/M40 family metallo-hydrolase [Bacteriovoracaceae bacterium]